MAKLDGLIKYHQWQVDEERRILADLNRQIADLEAKLAKLDADEAREVESVRSGDALGTLGAYRIAVKAQRKTLKAQHAKLDAEAEQQRDKVAEAFKSLKGFEVAKDQADMKAKKVRDKREQDGFDEHALRQQHDYRR